MGAGGGEGGGAVVVGWLLNVHATCWFISGTDLLHFTCCYTEIEIADQTFYITQYTDAEPTSPSADPLSPGRGATGVPMFRSLV